MSLESEKGPERIATRDEILGVIGRYVENAVVYRELSDDQGVYLLEVNVPGDKVGEFAQYAYLREGKFKTHTIPESTVYVLYHQLNVPSGGRNIANFVPETGEWVDIV